MGRLDDAIFHTFQEVFTLEYKPLIRDLHTYLFLLIWFGLAFVLSNMCQHARLIQKRCWTSRKHDLNAGVSNTSAGIGDGAFLFKE